MNVKSRHSRQFCLRVGPADSARDGPKVVLVSSSFIWALTAGDPCNSSYVSAVRVYLIGLHSSQSPLSRENLYLRCQSFTLALCRNQSSVICSSALISKDAAMWEESKFYSDLRLDP